MIDGFVNKHKCNEKLTIDAIEDASKAGRSRELNDSMEETDLKGEYVNKHEYNDERNIEENEGLYKDEKSRDLDDQKVIRQSSDDLISWMRQILQKGV
jgi:hypothetical protein